MEDDDFEIIIESVPDDLTQEELSEFISQVKEMIKDGSILEFEIDMDQLMIEEPELYKMLTSLDNRKLH